MTSSSIIALAAAIVAVLAVAGSLWTLDRARRRLRTLEQEFERGRSHFADVIANEVREQGVALAQRMAIARSEALTLLAAEERRITEERRREVALREREANTRLSAALAETQRSVEQRLADWGTHLNALQQSLTSNFEQIVQRQKQVAAELEARLSDDAEGFRGSLDEHRIRLMKLRDDLTRSVQEAAVAASAELETHGAERRRALSEVAARLQQREQSLQESMARDQAEAVQRLAEQLKEIEQHQVEQLRRVVARESQQQTARSTQEFETTVRAAREEAARRLSRQLDIAVERFAHDGDRVIADRVEGELRAIEGRIAALSARLDKVALREPAAQQELGT